MFPENSFKLDGIIVGNIVEVMTAKWKEDSDKGDIGEQSNRYPGATGVFVGGILG